MSTPVRKPPAPGTTTSRSTTSTNPPGTPISSRTPSRSSTPTSATANGVSRTRSTRSTPGTPLSARSAVKKPGAPSNLSTSSSPNDSNDDDARAETAALIQELKDRLQKAEQASEEYQKQVEVLQMRFDDALKDQSKLEERVHEEEERIEGLENEKRETIRQHRELENIYEAERASFMKEKDEAQAREDELHEIIQRLKDGLAQREQLKPGSDEEGRLSPTSSFRSSRNNSQQNLENGHFAPPTNLQRSNSRGSSKLLLQKDKIIESLRLELAEAQIKLVEMENLGGGRMQELERVLLETRMTNARLLEENESFQLLLREKTLNGDFSTGDFLRGSNPEARPISRDSRAEPGTSLADELEEADSVDLEASEATRRLETEVKELKEQNKALTLYINKIIERVLQHQGFESVLDKNDLDPSLPKANVDKDLPPPPPPKEASGASVLQRAKTVAMGPPSRRPRPMSYMAPSTSSVTEDPNTAPSIPLARSNSNRMSVNLHRRSTSEWPAAAVVNNMYRGPPASSSASGQISPAISSPRNSLFSISQRRSGEESRSPPLDGLASLDGTPNIDTPSPPRSVSSSNFERPSGAIMGGNKMRPLRLVQEAAEADAEIAARNKANRTSWIAGWFNKSAAANTNANPESVQQAS